MWINARPGSDTARAAHVVARSSGISMESAARSTVIVTRQLPSSWMKLAGGLARPRTPFPKIFTLLDGQTKHFFVTSALKRSLPESSRGGFSTATGGYVQAPSSCQATLPQCCSEVASTPPSALTMELSG